MEDSAGKKLLTAESAEGKDNAEKRGESGDVFERCG